MVLDLLRLGRTEGRKAGGTKQCVQGSLGENTHLRIPNLLSPPHRCGGEYYGTRQEALGADHEKSLVGNQDAALRRVVFEQEGALDGGAPDVVAAPEDAPQNLACRYAHAYLQRRPVDLVEHADLHRRRNMSALPDRCDGMQEDLVVELEAEQHHGQRMLCVWRGQIARYEVTVAYGFDLFELEATSPRHPRARIRTISWCGRNTRGAACRPLGHSVKSRE